MVSDIRSVGESEDGPFIIIAKEKGTTQAIGKTANALNQLLDFFSSCITLKSYTVHSIIRFFNSILYKFSSITSQWYSFISKIRLLFGVSHVI